MKNLIGCRRYSIIERIGFGRYRIESQEVDIGYTRIAERFGEDLSQPCMVYGGSDTDIGDLIPVRSQTLVVEIVGYIELAITKPPEWAAL